MATSLILDRMNLVSTISGGIFAGAAAYISFSEVPALGKFGINEQWRFFPYMYNKATKMQAPLAIISGTTAVLYSLRIAETSSFISKIWLGSGLAFIAIVPHTLILMMPINNKIVESNDSETNESQKRELLSKWSKLHMVRTVFSVVGFCAMVYGCIKYNS